MTEILDLAALRAWYLPDAVRARGGLDPSEPLGDIAALLARIDANERAIAEGDHRAAQLARDLADERATVRDREKERDAACVERDILRELRG